MYLSGSKLYPCKKMMVKVLQVSEDEKELLIVEAHTSAIKCSAHLYQNMV